MNLAFFVTIESCKIILNCSSILYRPVHRKHQIQIKKCANRKLRLSQTIIYLTPLQEYRPTFHKGCSRLGWWRAAAPSCTALGSGREPLQAVRPLWSTCASQNSSSSPGPERSSHCSGWSRRSCRGCWGWGGLTCSCRRDFQPNSRGRRQIPSLKP